MRGIDVYQGDGWPLGSLPAKCYQESDFVIVKATQGLSYKHTDYFRKMADQALKDKKLLGAYHYAAGHDPVREADYFLSIVKDYIGRAILCLDWEASQNSAWGSVTWCKRFIARIKEKTGIICFLYTGLDGIQQNKELANQVPLWFAGYSQGASWNSWGLPVFKYSLAPWANYTIWQYTSSNEKCDRNTTKLTKEQWKAYAEGSVKKHYPGAYPKLPPRGYYKFGDGMYTLVGWKPQIVLVQKALNWALGLDLERDGKYGRNTDKAVEEYQRKNGLPVNGCWGKKCEAVLKKLKK